MFDSFSFLYFFFFFTLLEDFLNQNGYLLDDRLLYIIVIDIEVSQNNVYLCISSFTLKVHFVLSAVCQLYLIWSSVGGDLSTKLEMSVNPAENFHSVCLTQTFTHSFTKRLINSSHCL